MTQVYALNANGNGNKILEFLLQMKRDGKDAPNFFEGHPVDEYNWETCFDEIDLANLSATFENTLFLMECECDKGIYRVVAFNRNHKAYYPVFPEIIPEDVGYSSNQPWPEISIFDFITFGINNISVAATEKDFVFVKNGAEILRLSCDDLGGK